MITADGGTFAAIFITTIGSLALGEQSILGITLDKANLAANPIQVTGVTSTGAIAKWRCGQLAVPSSPSAMSS